MFIGCTRWTGSDYLTDPKILTSSTTPEKALEIIRSQDHHFDKPHVVKVADNVYTAVGFHGATTSMIVGSDGVVMIDSLMGPKSAKNAMDALRAASGVKLPVKAIVYTHAHGDHTGGASAYIEYASDKASVRIIGPEGMGDDTGGNADIRPLLMKRGQFQFGRGLPSSQLIRIFPVSHVAQRSGLSLRARGSSAQSCKARGNASGPQFHVVAS